MAYNYEDFIRSANQAGMLKRFSDADLQTAQKSPEYGLSMLSLMKDADHAGTDEQRLLATEAATQLRKNYGVTAGSFSQATAAGTSGNAPELPAKEGDPLASQVPDFVYDDEEAYRLLLDQILNQGEFTYNPEEDPRWSQYRKTYLREGERATENALARSAAMTGGIPSSYAVGAANQAGNYYAAQLADKLPELEQMAYGRFMDDLGGKLSALDAMRGEREFDYQQYLNNWQMNEAAKQQAYDNAMALYQLLGYATPEIAEILGIPAQKPDSGYTDRPGGPGKDDKEDDGLHDQDIAKWGTGDIEILGKMLESGASQREIDDYIHAAQAEGGLNEDAARKLQYMYGVAIKNRDKDDGGKKKPASKPNGGVSGGGRLSQTTLR